MSAPSPLGLPALRDAATQNGSVNAHLASAWELRWHDLFWLERWQRWNDARHAWARTWPFVDFQYLTGGVYAPDAIPDPTADRVAREYIAARRAYQDAMRLYAEDA